VSLTRSLGRCADGVYEANAFFFAKERHSRFFLCCSLRLLGRGTGVGAESGGVGGEVRGGGGGVRVGVRIDMYIVMPCSREPKSATLAVAQGGLLVVGSW